jgi:hypothetical protein
MNGTRIEISANKKENVKLIFYGIGFIGLSVFLILAADEQQIMPALLLKSLIYVFLLILIPSLVFLLYRLSDNSPRIIIDSAGLTDHSAITSPGFIPWREIEGFRIKSIHSIPFLGIILKDPEAFYKSSPPVARFLNKLNKSMFRSNYLISVKTLNIEFDKFAELARSYHQKYTGAE